MKLARRELLTLLAGTACAPLRGARLGRAAPRMLRLGPERTRIPYDDPRAAEKRVLFERINRDRARARRPAGRVRAARGAGGRPVLPRRRALRRVGALGPRRDARPYLRWGLAGGVDFHAQNAAAWTRRLGPPRRAVGRASCCRRHESMMAETPPHDGHRRTILDPHWTHVGIGAGRGRRTVPHDRRSSRGSRSSGWTCRAAPAARRRARALRGTAARRAGTSG